MAELQIPNFVNVLAQADQAAAFANDQRRQNALAGFMQQNGAALMQGDQNALAQFAQYDPQAAFGLMNQQQDRAWRTEDRQYQRDRDQRQDARQARADERADQEWQFRVQQYAAERDEATRLAEAQQIEDAVKMGLALPDAASWDAMMQTQAPELVGQFDQRQALGQRYMDMAAILKGQGGGQFRPATAAEAGGYGAAAGQFGPDGRFYPINPPSGLAIETGPDGQMRVTQGSGAGSAAGKPFTEAQSKDNVFATRAEGALAAFEPIAGAMTSRGDRAAEMVPFGLARGMQSDDFQVAQNAGDEFLQAILRKDTGAAITAQEQELYGKTYIPQPGDSEAVMAQKVQARRRAVEALKAGMSPAQMVAQERALRASGSQQLPPVQQPAQPAQRASERPAQGGLQLGHTEDGYRYIGGDPSDQASWQQVQ